VVDTFVTVVGNLTDDPEFRFTPNGTAVANFRLAVTPASARVTPGGMARPPSSQRVAERQDAQVAAASRPGSSR
jgi:single-stranded DNA-binding protein